MMNSKPTAAIIYDYDGTLARGNSLEAGLIPALGMTGREFWVLVKTLAKQHDADEILIYLQQVLEKAAQNGHRVTQKSLAEHGSKALFFQGVQGWFDHINGVAERLGLQLEHYVLSSGLVEMISGSPIAGEFKQIYASRYLYDQQGVAQWPAIAVNYTAKTQYLFRINKGIQSNWDNSGVNQRIPHSQRAVPFQRMLFIGDGETDIAAMKVMREKGGYALAVFDPEQPAGQQELLRQLVAEERCNYIAPADYRPGSQLDTLVSGLLQKMSQQMTSR